MTEFKQLITDCGLSLRGAARLLGVSYDSVKGWHCGKNECPQGVIDELTRLNDNVKKLFGE